MAVSFTKFSKFKKVITVVAATITGSLFLIAITFFIWTKLLVAEKLPFTESNSVEEKIAVVDRFPVGVNIADKEINEDPLVDWYVETHLSINTSNSRKQHLLDRLLAQVTKWDWYQNLASSVSRILVIYPGERREEIASNFGEILGWNKEERDLFSEYIAKADPILEEGKYFPGRYVVASEATPENVADVLYENFEKEILQRYDSEVEEQVPLAEALIIASLLEREAYDFTDMRYISGVIWNRLFIGMPLQLDATLQYARGSKLSEALWWPKVVPADKFINSPYNTYKNAGLPPAPISNPSTEAIVAALNPRSTECMFYFHDSNGEFYCTKTYEEHVAKLRQVYGRGK